MVRCRFQTTSLNVPAHEDPARTELPSPRHTLVFQWFWNGPPFVLFSHDEFEKAESLR